MEPVCIRLAAVFGTTQQMEAALLDGKIRPCTVSLVSSAFQYKTGLYTIC